MLIKNGLKPNMISRDLYCQMERVENTITQLESLKLVLDEKLHKIDQQRPENTLAKGEMSRRGLE